MTHLVVNRSVTRQLLLMFAGLALVLVAIDVMWEPRIDIDLPVLGHVEFDMGIAGPPETNDDGALTSRGHAQRRQDILWSSVFIVTGGAILVFAGMGLARRHGILELTDQALRARILSTSGYLDVPWSDIEAVRSGTDDTGSEVDDPLLIVSVRNPATYPANLWGAEWRGDELRIAAGTWATPVEEVVVHASLLAERHDETAAALHSETEEVE